MPELSRFQGMIIKLLYLDDEKHHKPHIHVYYGEYEASIGMDGELLSRFFASEKIEINSSLVNFT